MAKLTRNYGILAVSPTCDQWSQIATTTTASATVSLYFPLAFLSLSFGNANFSCRLLIANGIQQPKTKGEITAETNAKKKPAIKIVNQMRQPGSNIPTPSHLLQSPEFSFSCPRRSLLIHSRQFSATAAYMQISRKVSLLCESCFRIFINQSLWAPEFMNI